MKSLRTILLILVTGAATLFAQDPSAMVTSVDGNTTVEAEGVTTAAKVGMDLLPGSIITVKDGSASLVFMSGDLMELAAGDALTLGADMEASTLTSGGGTRGVGSDDAVTVAEEGVGNGKSGKWQSQLAYIYGVRGDASVVPVAPRLAIASPKPVFYWFDGDSSRQGTERSYTITLKDDAGKTLLRSDVSGTVYQMNSFTPGQMPAGYNVEPGKRYTWTVAPKGETSTASEAAFIYIDDAGIKLAAAKQQRLADMREKNAINEQSYHTLMSLYYLDERERLFSDAIPHLLALSAFPTGKSFAGTQMALLLNRFGNELAAAAAYYARFAR